MEQRFGGAGGRMLIRRAAALSPTAPGDDVGISRLAAAVRIGVRAGMLRKRPVLDAMYLAVCDRVRELHADGLRAEQALMAVKREVMEVVAHVGADAVHAAEVVQLVVRWSVSAYYAAN